MNHRSPKKKGRNNDSARHIQNASGRNDTGKFEKEKEKKRKKNQNTEWRIS